MKPLFVDSNVFIRFLTFDDQEQHKKAAILLRKALNGKLALVTGPPVLLEVNWAMRRAYRRPREEVLEFFQTLLEMKGMTILEEDTVYDALALSRASGQEFPDAFIAAMAHHYRIDSIVTFNQKHFERLGFDIYSM